MINDPAWFLSSLAQASAGLIGLLGAVLILRLQQQSVAIQESRNHVLVAFAGLRSTLVSIERGLSDFLEWVPGDIAAIRSALADGQTMRQVQQERDVFGGSRGGTAWSVPVSDEVLASRESDGREAEFIRPILQTLISLKSPEGLDVAARPLREALHGVSPDRRRYLENNAVALLDTAIRLREIHRAIVPPWGALGLLGVIGYLAFASVAWPLSNLLVPRLGSSNADPVFYAFVLGLALLFLYLGAYVRQLVRQGDLRPRDD